MKWYIHVNQHIIRKNIHAKDEVVSLGQGMLFGFLMGAIFYTMPGPLFLVAVLVSLLSVLLSLIL